MWPSIAMSAIVFSTKISNTVPYEFCTSAYEELISCLLQTLYDLFIQVYHSTGLIKKVQVLHLNCRKTLTISLWSFSSARCKGVCCDTGVVSPSGMKSEGREPRPYSCFSVWAFGLPPLSSSTLTSSVRPFSHAMWSGVSPWNMWEKLWYGN